MKAIFRILSITFGLAWTFVQGQSVWLSASRDTVKLGEPFQLKIYVLHDNADEITFPVAPKEEGDLSLIEADESPKWGENDAHTGKKILVQTYRVAAFAPDSIRFQLPVLIKGETILSKPLHLHILRSVPENDKAFQDLAPLAIFPPDYWGWFFLILSLLLGFAIAWFLYRKFFKKVRELGKAPDVVEERVAFKAAMHRLEALRSLNIQEKSQLEAYFVELSDLFRTYVEQVLDVPAKEISTHELLQALSAQSRIGIPEEILHRIQKSLETADLVKFADRFIGKVESYSVTEDIKKAIIRIETELRHES